MAKKVASASAIGKMAAEGRAWLAPIEVSSSSRRKVNLVDLFAGIGGFHYGVAAAAAERGRRVDPILVSENNSECKATYFDNHRVKPQGNVRRIDPESEKVADILTAGFPCQPFSNSGLKKGLSDPRGQFYNTIEKIITGYSAKSFILENVPGIRMNGGGNHRSDLSWVPGAKIGSTMKKLESRLRRLAERSDYEIRWIELDSSDFGSPQVRKRVYIVGLHRDFDHGRVNLGFSGSEQFAFVDVAEGIVVPGTELSDSQLRNLKSFMSEPPSYKDGMRRVGQAYLCKGGNVGQGYHAHGKVPTLTKVWARFLPVYIPSDGEKVPRLGEPVFEPDRKYGSGTIRRASIREVMRLQGFPDDFVPNPSASEAYQQAGNAVNALVVKALAGRLLDKIYK